MSANTKTDANDARKEPRIGDVWEGEGLKREVIRFDASWLDYYQTGKFMSGEMLFMQTAAFKAWTLNATLVKRGE